MADLILYFATNAETMRALNALKHSGVTPRLITKPNSVANASNLCLSLDEALRTDAMKALDSAHVAPFEAG